jgi:hypothetical protein
MENILYIVCLSYTLSAVVRMVVSRVQPSPEALRKTRLDRLYGRE